MKPIWLLVCFLCAGCTAFYPSAALREKAEGYKTKSLRESAPTIDFSDGISSTEALLIAQHYIYGAVDNQNLPVVSYSGVECAGDEWKVDVVVQSFADRVIRPIFIDKVTASTHGPDWWRSNAARTPVGESSSFRYERDGDEVIIRVTSRRFWEHEMEEVREEVIGDATAALEVAQQHLPEFFMGIAPSDFVVYLRRWRGGYPSPNLEWEVSAKRPNETEPIIGPHE